MGYEQEHPQNGFGIHGDGGSKTVGLRITINAEARRMQVRQARA